MKNRGDFPPNYILGLAPDNKLSSASNQFRR